MNPAGRLKLIGQVRDLQIVDSEGNRCGIVDDIALARGSEGGLRIDALMVGPGAWRGRVPRWVLWLLQRVAGDAAVRIPWHEVARIGSVVELKRPARALGLMRAEDWARRYVPKGGAL